VNQRAQEQGALMSDVSCLEAENGFLSSSRESKSALPLPFCSIQALRDWMIPTHIGEGCLLYSVY